jgi:hypothetical protein
MKIINSIVKYFVPPIFRYKIFREKIIKLFREKDRINYEVNNYSRHSFILAAIFKRQKDNCTYLEIGTDKDEVFNTIPLPLGQKIGIDPNSGGTIKIDSDNFFKKNEKLFDVIFIDGLHHYEQCKRDCKNAMKFLKKDGIIFFHDFLPKNSYEEKVPRMQSQWCGDVWKVAADLNQSKNIEFHIINIDRGIGLLKLKDNFQYIEVPNIKQKGFEDLVNTYLPQLNIINCEKAFKIINN